MSYIYYLLRYDGRDAYLYTLSGTKKNGKPEYKLYRFYKNIKEVNVAISGNTFIRMNKGELFVNYWTDNYVIGDKNDRKIVIGINIHDLTELLGILSKDGGVKIEGRVILGK